ncbi:hypothetical protein AAII07_30255 [Microvirga sp. 0TCS3.31]
MSVFGRMNLWQWSWLAVTLVSFLSLGLIYPLTIVHQSNPGRDAFREVLLREIQSEKCGPYISRPLAELGEPASTSSGVDCSAIYFSRRANGEDIHPYSIAVYDAKESARKLGRLCGLVALFGCLTLAASALLYFVGRSLVRFTQSSN